MNKKFNTSQLVLLGLMTAILRLMAYTPLGYLNIGPLAITFNVIPVAVAAITLGPVGGAIVGSVLGLSTASCSASGVGGTSAMGAVLFGINPVLAFIQRFVPRMIDGLLLGYIFRGMRKVSNTPTACFVTGFCSAFLNTALFMSLLVLLFGNTEYMQTLMGGKNVIAFICGFVGINAVCEMVSSTIITGAVGLALYKAHFVPAVKRANVA